MPALTRLFKLLQVVPLLDALEADEAPAKSCTAAFSPLCLPRAHIGLLKYVSVESARDCCSACAHLAPCASWELRGGSRCILRSVAPVVGAREPGVACISNALKVPPPPPTPPPLPFVPTNNGNAFGVWTKYGSVGDPTPLSTCPILSGHLVKVQWGEIEPADGIFNFSVLDARIADATGQGLNVGLMVWVASPGGVAAKWLTEDKLVPAVRVVGSGSHPTVDYAWYFSDVYCQRHTRMINALAAHLKALPDSTKRWIRSFQPALGSTGDFTPWHGTPASQRYAISKLQWIEYADNRTEVFVSAFKDSGIPLTWNFGDDIASNCSAPGCGSARARLNYLFSRLPPNNTNVKLGMVSHSYQLNGEADYVNQWAPYISAGVARRSHGEVGDFSGRELEQPFWHYWQTCLWCIYFGLDTWNVGGDILADRRHWYSLELFSRYGGTRTAATAPGAFIGMHDGLDASDARRFPAREFGAVRQSNAARYQKIAQAFAAKGAKNEDVQAAMGQAMASRKAKGLNDVGWRIHTGNYEKWMKMLNPDASSIGLWRVNSTDPTQPHGRFTRGFHHSTKRDSFSFSVDPAISGNLSLAVVYLDIAGNSTWSASFRRASGALVKSMHVTTGGTGRYLTAKAAMPSAAFGSSMTSVDLIIKNEDEVDDIFSFLEIAKMNGTTQRSHRIMKFDDADMAPYLSSLHILNNTDFPSNCVSPYAPSTSIEMCATLCAKREDCVATIFNPGANIKPACAFKCRSDNPIHKDGITATIVRPDHEPTCAPPHPPQGPAAPFTPPSGVKDPDWLVRYNDANLLHADSNLETSLFPYIGNGYLATHPVGGKVPAATSTLFVSGVFNGIAVQSPCVAGYCRAPYRASIPTYRVQPSGAPLLSGRFALDMEKATLARRLRVDDALDIEERWYAHLVHRQLLVHEIGLKNSGAKARSIPIQAVAGTADLDPSGSFIFANSTRDGVHIVFGASNHSERPELQRTQVAVASNTVPAGTSLRVGAKASQTHYFISAVATSLDCADPKASAEQALHEALDPTAVVGLLASHEIAWKARWDQGRVEVDGNLELAQAINSSMYFLLSSVRADWPQGMSPGGLASDGYSGHTFWDQEYWMVPSLILLQPDSARSCLQYRIDRMAGAVSKARSQGYAGLMWPCESAYSGYEVQGSAGNGTRSETARGIGGEGDYGLYEQHWNSDISFAAWQYWQASGNTTDLRLHLEPMLRGSAEYWVSRVEVTKGRGGPVDGLYHINHVMPPDEYVDGVDDAVFTNFGAATILQKATQAAIAAGRAPGANWTEVASKLFLNFDTKQRYHPEYNGYVPGVRAPPSERNGAGSRLVKQADVILMGFPYDANANNTNNTMSNTVRKNDLEIYSNFTDRGSVAMTWGMFAVGWLEIGEQSKAEEAFKRGYANIKSPFGVWTETPTGGTVNFITGAGGFLQSVVFGYGGLRLREDRLDLSQPPLPHGTDALTLRGVHYRGNKLLLRVNTTDVSVQVMKQAGNVMKLDLCLPGRQPSLLVRGKACSFVRGIAASVRPAGTC